MTLTMHWQCDGAAHHRVTARWLPDGWTVDRDGADLRHFCTPACRSAQHNAIVVGLVAKATRAAATNAEVVSPPGYRKSLFSRHFVDDPARLCVRHPLHRDGHGVDAKTRTATAV